MAVETYQYDQISIHALREEGDPTAWWPLLMGTYFYPRPPRGGRHMAIFLSLALPEFLSTPSARRATNLDSVISQLFRFLSTPSARRATTSSSQKYCPDCQFLSTPSARRATSITGMVY